MGDDSFISHFLKLAAKELQLPAQAILDIPNEDDWSFIIKITAIIERSLGHLVTKGLPDEATKEAILGLRLEAKIHLAFDKNLIDKSTREKFRLISSLRNRAAHHFLFSFKEIFKNPDVVNAYKSNFSDVWIDPVTFGDTKIDSKTFIVDNPKLTIFVDALSRLSIADLDAETQRLKKEGERLLETFKAFQGHRQGLLNA